MEWVETTGPTVEDALDAALDELGVDEDEVEFEVVQAAKAGLFGRLGANPARVRARVKPISREKPGERNRGRSSRSGRGREGKGGTGNGRGRPTRAGGGEGTKRATEPSPESRSAPASEPPLFVWPMKAKHDSTESKASGRRIIPALVEMALFRSTTKR